MNIHDKIVEACENGDIFAVKKYVEQGADIHVWCDWPLQCAAGEGYLDIVKYLIEQGADIHEWNDYVLRSAAWKGHLQVVNYLRKVVGNKYKCHRCIIKSTCLKLCEDFRNAY